MANWRELITTWDQSIRRGEGKKVRAELKEALAKTVPRPERAEIARVAWRCDLPLLGIRLLNPIVHPSAKRPSVPTDAEKAEYSACLTMAGADDEALRTLTDVSGKKYPAALLYEGFAHVARWGYAEAIPPLKRYLASPRLSPYQALVGRVNLAAALVWGRDHQSAEALLGRLLKETRTAQATFARGYCLELDAIRLIDRLRFKEAEGALERAEEFLKESESAWGFFVRKWRAILSLLKSQGSREAVATVDAIAAEAKEHEDWETIRQCDAFLARAARDSDRLRRVHFGTPFEAFQRRILDDWGEPIELGTTYHWRLGPAGKARDLSLLQDESGELRTGSLLHRLLYVLSTDFYRPFPIAGLYGRLYPGEYFNPQSSPARIHEAVKRLRLWFEEKDFPLSVRESGGSYQLEAEAPVRLLVSAEKTAPTRQDPLAQRLKSKWPEGPFSIQEACDCLGLQRRTVQRLLEDLVGNGALQRMGRSRATRYSFAA